LVGEAVAQYAVDFVGVGNFEYFSRQAKYSSEPKNIPNSQKDTY
jgi:hypothetical protein